MHGKRFFLILGLLVLLATSGGLVWFWWTGIPPKAPLRSRSVQIEYSMPSIAELPAVYRILAG